MMDVYIQERKSYLAGQFHLILGFTWFTNSFIFESFDVYVCWYFRMLVEFGLVPSKRVRGVTERKSV